MIQLTDSHGHLTMVFHGPDGRGPARAPSVAEVRELVERARGAGVTRILVPGTDRKDSVLAVEIAEAHEGVYAAVGFHPHEAREFVEDRDLALFEDLLKSKKTVAIGEIGLDFYYDHSPRPTQKSVLEAQLRFAKERSLPVLLHNRESEQELLPVLEEVFGPRGETPRGVFHSFCADAATAQAAIDLGFFVSFSGMLTFNAAENVREVARVVALDHVLIETDAPYLAPVPFRGKPNEPAYVKKTAEKLAQLRGVSLETVAAQTTANFRRLFSVS